MSAVAAAVVGGTVLVGAYGAKKAGEASEAGAASVERSTAQQLEFERERFEEESRRWELNRAEEMMRYRTLTDAEQQRYDELKAIEQQRYAAMTELEQRRYDDRKSYYESLTAEEKSRYQASVMKEQERYEAQILQREGMLEEAREALQPFVTSEQAARQQMAVEMGLAPGEAGEAYKRMPGYEAALEERKRQVEQEAAIMGTAYSGRRMEEAAKAGSDVQSQYYQNYMNMLGAMASPQTSTALASMGMGMPVISGQTPGVGQLPFGSTPTGTLVSGQLPGTGQLTMGSMPGVGTVPTMGTGLVSGAQAAAQMRTAGAMAMPQFMSDVAGMGAQMYGGYLAGGGGMTPTTTATTSGQYGPMAGGYAWG